MTCCEKAIKKVAVDYTVTNRDNIILCDTDAKGSDLTISLLTAGGKKGKSYTIINLGDTYKVIIVPKGSETIGGSPTVNLYQKDNAIEFTSDNSNWQIQDAYAMSAHGMSSEGRDRKSTRLNSSHIQKSRMPSSA